MVPEASRGLPGTPLGIDPVFGHPFLAILAPIWGPIGLPFGSNFGVIFYIFFGSALGTLLGGLGSNLGAILAPFWLRFGTLLGVPAKSEN